ncbi:hypothetical protein ACT4ZG_02130 [Acinetobacter baumannii]
MTHTSSSGTVNDPTATVVVNVDGVDYPAVNKCTGTDGTAGQFQHSQTVHTPLP